MRNVVIKITLRSNRTSICAVYYLYYELISKGGINKINENGIIKEMREIKYYTAYLIAILLYTYYKKQHA